MVDSLQVRKQMVWNKMAALLLIGSVTLGKVSSSPCLSPLIGEMELIGLSREVNVMSECLQSAWYSA